MRILQSTLEKVNNLIRPSPKDHMKLSTANLASLSSLLATPQYDRAALEPGVLHFGVGNFHRAHMASYFDDLFNQDFENNKQWGIVGCGLMPQDTIKRDVLLTQDWLQTLTEQDGETSKSKLIGSMIDFIATDKDTIEKYLADGIIKIVSLTITEGGYYLKDDEFDLQHPDIQHDIENPENPKTIFGILVKTLKLRKEKGLTPFSVLSCDNLPHNGNVVRSVITKLAEQTDPELAKWIDEKTGFPNSMVDRITPAPSREQQKVILDKYGYLDRAPLVCEPFRQWIIEDTFSEGRPHLDKCENIMFVPDVQPYEFMKIRILNGGHASLCYPGALLGLEYVHECMEHPTISKFLDTLEKNEIIPTVGEVPEVNLDDYWQTIQKRFSNPTLNDTLRRNCFDGASRQPKFIIPVARDNLKADGKVDGLAIVSAMWCRYCYGTTEAGEPIQPNDPQWDRLTETAKKSKDDPKIWLNELVDVYGKVVAENPTFVEAFTKALNSIHSEGVEATMKQYIESKKVVAA